MADDGKRQRLEILDYTPEEWDRYKWQVERDAHERELILKEREDRRSFLRSPLILSIVGALPEDVAVLLIEHDMDVVFSFARRISVLVDGALFVEGAPDDVARDQRVREVYLGEAHRG